MIVGERFDFHLFATARLLLTVVQLFELPFEQLGEEFGIYSAQWRWRFLFVVVEILFCQMKIVVLMLMLQLSQKVHVV